MRRILFAVMSAVLLLQSAWALRHIVKVYPQDKEAWKQVIKTEDLDDLGQGPGFVTIITTDKQMDRLRGAGCTLEVLARDIEKIKRHKGGLHSFTEMRAELEMIEAGYPGIARLDSIGHSWEGRPILCLKISDNVNSTEDEPKLMYMGCLHAREWITVEVPLRLSMLLTDSFGINPAITELVNEREIYIIPCANPDGFVYDYNTNNYWRKNRRNNNDGTYGVDLNRNYDGSQDGNPAGMWGAVPGCSHTPSAETYCGPSAFSEPECQAIRDLFQAYPFDMSMSYHTYGELLMWPWGYTGSPAPDGGILSAMGTEMAAQITCEDGMSTYTPQQMMSLYPTTGTSEDWLYGYSRFQTSHTDLAYIVEMCYYNFHDTTTSIVNQVCTQNLEAAVLMAQMAVNPYSYTVPGAPTIAASDTTPSGGNFTLNWTPAQANAGIDKYELHELTGLVRTTDSAEAGIGRWDTTRFKVSANRSHSPTHSFRADSSHSLNASLISALPFTVQANDSLTYWRWVSTEAGWDYFYAEISADGGASWTNLETLDGAYESWTRKAFSMAPYVGQQVLVRFRYNTDYMILGRGVYLDNIHPCEGFASDSLLADTITGQAYGISGLPVGTYYFNVRAHNPKGWGRWSNMAKVTVPTGVAGNPSSALPTVYALNNAYPNPSRGQTTFKYQLPKESKVSLTVYNIMGQAVKRFDLDTKPAGYHQVNWNDNTLPNGIYFYRLSATPKDNNNGGSAFGGQAGEFSSTKKLLIVR